MWQDEGKSDQWHYLKTVGYFISRLSGENKQSLALFLSRLITICSDTTPIHSKRGKIKSSASVLGERNEMCLKCF